MKFRFVIKAVKANEKCIRHLLGLHMRNDTRRNSTCRRICLLTFPCGEGRKATPFEMKMFDVSLQRPRSSHLKKYEEKSRVSAFHLSLRYKRALKKCGIFVVKGFDISDDFNGCLSSAFKTKE